MSDIKGWTGWGPQRYIETSDGQPVPLAALASLDASRNLVVAAATASGSIRVVDGMPATATAIASGAADVNAAVAAAAGLRLLGFAAAESAPTPAAAEFRIVHGATAAGPLLLPVKLQGRESTSDWFGPDGIACPNGLSIDRVTGTTEIVLFTKVVS